MFLFLLPPFVFTLSLAAFLFVVFFFLAPNSKGYLRAGLFLSASLCCICQLPLQREGANTWRVEVTHGSTGYSEAPCKPQNCCFWNCRCLSVSYLVPCSSWKSRCKYKDQTCLKITVNLWFRVILIKKCCKSRISHLADKIRQSLSSSMGGKNKVEMNVIKISDMHAASLSLKQLVLVHSGN